jgi:RNA polymerase sigma-70 factor (ECF subfamily)
MEREGSFLTSAGADKVPVPSPSATSGGVRPADPPLSLMPATLDTASEEVPASGTSLRRPDPDLELVERAREGDTRAFDALVEKYTPKLYGLVYHMTSNREDTNDILQDVFAKAYRALKRFRGKSSFYTWIYSIATNMTLNFLKKRNRRRTMSLDDVDLAIENDREFIEVTSKSDPVREANISELQQRLNMAMQKLSVDHRTVVTMFDIQAMPHAEIAKILGISEGTVRSRLFYAHRQLQAYLEDFRK